MPQPRYKICLQSYMAECEANYFRLQQLLPDDCDEVGYDIELPGLGTGRLAISVLQRCKYTSMLAVNLENSTVLAADQRFELRVYHDARLVEVTAFQSRRNVMPRYNYPNRHMYQQDEKWQQHRFLSECLHYCLQNGMTEIVGEPV